ncbi:coiled-coil domain-containing protein 42 like-2 [Lates calcarifer]|uniref:Coiled-coil domain-containing protein 42 like-2 n=1 Tax=Lates calcarifer TaxID=8187 RepID=A0A4W6G9B4_LATCA|nr:coiled-coil domain-containing protein 42 like-2 [Lates calcarifer]
MNLSKPIREYLIFTDPKVSAALVELNKKRHEDETLKAVLEERRKELESVQQRAEKLEEEQQKAEEFKTSFDLFLKDDDADRLVEKAERESREVLQKDEEILKLKEEEAELMKRKQKLEREVQRHTKYWDIMEQMVKMTKFTDVDSLANHLESQLLLRDRLLQREREKLEQVDQLRKTLMTLEDEQHLFLLQKNNELSQLQTELEEALAEALTWERKWSRIQETAAKKTLLLGQIKMATLNLYEMTGGTLEGEEGVDINDTEKHLDKIKLFILDHEDIVKQYQSSQRHSDGQKRQRGKKKVTSQIKKH